MLMAALVVAGLWAAAASAQRRPGIVVASLLRIQPAAQTALPIEISLPDAVPPASFIRLRGLPATAALSDGHSIAPGAWAIPVASLPRLTILLPEGATGQSELSIMLVSGDGSVLAEARSTLIVAAAPPAPNTATAGVLRITPPLEPSATAPPVQLSPDARERAVRLVKKGDEQLAEGGIAQARLLYERAADAGLAQGAMAMAATYDPVELQHLGARGLQPDLAAARRWYERARQLGAVEAEDRLRRLRAQ
jgi:TPR repeat protein